MHVLLTGGAGMLGSSIAEQWAIRRPRDELTVVTRRDVDLRDFAATAKLIAARRPDAIIHTAARVGGIAAKIAEPTDYLLDNLLIDASVIGGAVSAGIGELLYIGSAAVYPEDYRQPLIEQDLLAGPLESANEGYAIAKIAGTKLCEYASRQHGVSYRTAVPSNLYGAHDRHGLAAAHLIAAALTKVHAAFVSGQPDVNVWGDGRARREFTFSTDLSGWLVMQIGSLANWPSMLNLGVGEDHTITEYYEVACSVVGYQGQLVYDTSKPAGVPQRILDSSAARALGWDPQTSLEDGMAQTYRSYLSTVQP